MSNRVLGTIAIVCAPAFLVETLLTGGQEMPLIVGIASMIFMLGSFCSHIGLWRIAATGKSRWGRAVLGIELALVVLIGNLALPKQGQFTSLIFTLLFAGVWLAIGVAVLPYRLYDIDLIINRALVYGGLSALVVGVYLVGVVYLGAMLNSAVETVVQTLKLPYAAIVVDSSAAPVAVASRDEDPSARGLIAVPLTYQGERVGELRVAPRSGEPGLSAADRRLLAAQYRG